MADISKIKALDGITYNVKDATARASIPNLKIYRTVTGTAAITSSPYYASRYDISDSSVTSYTDGMMISIKVPVAGNGTYGTCLQINNLGYKPIVYNINSMISTRYGVGSQITCVYNSTQTASAYLNSASASTITGCWQVCDYDANTTTTYGTIPYYFRPYTGAEALYRYKLCALSKDNKIVPMTVTNQTNTTQVAKVPTQVAFRPEKIWLYNKTDTINANSVVGGQALTEVGYLANGCQYNFNASISAYQLIYLRGTYNKTTGLFTLYKDNSSPCKSYYTTAPDNATGISLTDYFVSGYYYILVGSTYSSNDYLQLFEQNPLYYFDGTNLITANLETATTSKNGLMTSADKTKLNEIATGAEVNVQSDWSITDTSSDAFIKNKPTIPAAAANGKMNIKMNGTVKGNFTANQSSETTIDLGTVITSHQDISGKENTSNKVTSISASSTDTQYPSAKCVYTLIGDIETLLAAI